MKVISKALFFCIGVTAVCRLNAQSPGSFSTLDVSVKLTLSGDDGALLQGHIDQGAFSNLGVGMRMMWYPRKGAFRAGQISGEHSYNNPNWDDANIGKYSFATGTDTRAYGENTFATGLDSHAIGAGSLVGGMYSWAWGPRSLAFGFSSTTHGDASIALGIYCWAQGHYSFASGAGGNAIGAASAAMNNWTIANGVASISAGDHTTANPYASLVIGRWNTTAAPVGAPAWSLTSWEGTDPVFVIGNGTDAEHPKDALVVKKNGDVTISKRQGDILMGEFGNPGD